MAEQGIFKTSMFGGFDKQSVLTYIDELTANAQAREKQLEEEKGQLESQYEELKENERKLKEKLQEYEETLKEAQEAQAALTEKEKQIVKLTETLNQYNQKNVALQDAFHSNEEKGRKYDAVASQVGIVLVEAQKQADAIVSRAHQQADRIAQESVDSIYDINKRIDQFKEDMYHLRAFASQTLQSFDDKMAQMDMAIKEAEGHLYISAGTAGMEEQQMQEAYPTGDNADSSDTQPGGTDFFSAPNQE